MLLGILKYGELHPGDEKAPDNLCEHVRALVGPAREIGQAGVRDIITTRAAECSHRDLIRVSCNRQANV